MDIESPEQEILQQSSAHEQWDNIMTASIRSNRAYLDMVLSREAALPLDRSMEITSAVRRGRYITAHVLEEPNFAKYRLKSRTAGIASSPKPIKDDGTSLKTSKLSSQEFQYAGVSVIDVRECQDGTSDISLELDGKKKFKLGEPDSAEMWLEPVSEYDTLALRREAIMLRGYIDNKNITAPGKVMKSGEFPRPTGTLETRDGLDEAQNKAYGMAMAYEQCPVLFVHGGPGTGKTSTICNIVEGHMEKGRNVLVLSHSNKGAQVPAERLHDKGVEVHIAGNDPMKVMEKLRHCRIKHNASYPEERISAVKRMSDEEILALLPKEVAMQLLSPTHKTVVDMGVKQTKKLNFRFFGKTPPEVIEAIKEKRKEMIDEIIGGYNQKIEKRTKEYRKSIEGGGVTFSTLGTLLNDGILEKTNYDVVIVDEATRMSMPDVVIALQKAGKQIIFVGDPLQLGNIPLSPDDKKDLKYMLSPDSIAASLPGHYKDPVKHLREESPSYIYPTEEEADKAVEIYEQGPFAAAILGSKDPEKDLPYVFLDEDRRSLPAIVNVLSPLIYKGKLKPGREADEKLGNGVVQWTDTSKLSPHEKTSGTSRKNTVEVQLIVDKVLHSLFREGVQPEDIAVIATYGS